MTNEQGWWRRVGDKESGFTFLKVDGGELVWEAGLERIDRLAIPPGWTDVHIAPSSKRKVQAWGRDAAGRKQYIYSEEAVAERARQKWDRVLLYARALPTLREVTNRHMKRDSLDREKVLAVVVRLMSRAYFRIGSERYAEKNKTFGIATLKKHHLEVRGNDLVFTYVGKRRKDQRRVVADTPLVEIIREIVELPGVRLFRYRDGSGTLCNVTARSVNRYIKEILHERYTSKDLRTFGGTVRAATILADLGAPSGAREAHRNTVMTARLVASELGNTPAIARSAYIHPAVFEQYEAEGRTIAPLMRKGSREVHSEEPVEYYPEEAALMRFLERYG
ncbi:MAG: DNA topoisomerase IB [Gemmatimonadetes bacterium]|nr:DNA topoisomerase IB [Gemmatimonadota bacterium]NIQ53570.1 DNA topoisomerase IB [Gemmatimonadota bacterium]NIU73727.1 DNA topoisomerase IB [Gammaproteobacteria bacterium]NIX43868.1 DNA topoisomerase IB [Gemmatimonadota bacterium]NIY08082.1 DNA topoisomerase IB [Gemmatimonadota bacterium]